MPPNGNHNGIVSAHDFWMCFSVVAHVQNNAPLSSLVMAQVFLFCLFRQSQSPALFGGLFSTERRTEFLAESVDGKTYPASGTFEYNTYGHDALLNSALCLRPDSAYTESGLFYSSTKNERSERQLFRARSPEFSLSGENFNERGIA